MRARRVTPFPTAAQLVVGASVLAFPATAVAFSHSGARHSTAPLLSQLHAARPATVRYGHRMTLRGSVSVTAAGVPIELRYRPDHGRGWQIVARGHVHANGHFALTAAISHSGALQVRATRRLGGATQLTPSAPLFGAEEAAGPSATTTSTSTSPLTLASRAIAILPSPVSHLAVKPQLILNGAGHTTTAVAGQSTQINGRLLPGIAGRTVVLQVQQGQRWVSAAVARTRQGGGFDFRYVPTATSREHVEVAFAGDELNSQADSAQRSVVPMEYAEVSWYEDGGSTACGFHATYGIASRTLPCGSKVTFSYGGRSVVATVDDRGPFVYSRLYDLSQSTAAALGMQGLATVLASI
jgi:rare lipoprotein A